MEAAGLACVARRALTTFPSRLFLNANPMFSLSELYVALVFENRNGRPKMQWVHATNVQRRQCVLARVASKRLLRDVARRLRRVCARMLEPQKDSPLFASSSSSTN